MPTLTREPKILRKSVKELEKDKDFIHVLKVKPKDKLKVFLGRFDLADKMSGFSIEIRPRTATEDTVTTHISRIGDDINAKFFLDISNKGPRAITAKIHQV